MAQWITHNLLKHCQAAKQSIKVQLLVYMHVVICCRSPHCRYDVARVAVVHTNGLMTSHVHHVIAVLHPWSWWRHTCMCSPVRWRLWLFIQLVCAFLGSTSHQAGLETGDVILEVNNVDVKNLNTDGVASIVRQCSRQMSLTLMRYRKLSPNEMHVWSSLNKHLLLI